MSQKIDQWKLQDELLFSYGGPKPLKIFNKEIEQLSLDIPTEQFVDI